MKKILILLLLTIGVTNAQVGIGNTDPKAALDVTSANNGLLIPRVALTSTADNTTVISLEESELVYNTATVADVIPGYYFWNGTFWETLGSSTSMSWDLVGNTATSPGTWAAPGTNFLGTTDAQDFFLRTNNINRLMVSQLNGNMQLGGNYTNNNAKLHILVPNTDASTFGLRINYEGTPSLSTNNTYGAYIQNNSSVASQTGFRFGIYNTVLPSTGAARSYGIYNSTYTPTVASSTRHTGFLNEMFIQIGNVAGTDHMSAINNVISVASAATNTGGVFGIRNEFSTTNAASTSNMYGIHSQLVGRSAGKQIGISNFVQPPTTMNGSTQPNVGFLNQTFARGSGTSTIGSAALGGSLTQSGHFGIVNQIRLVNYSGGTPAGIYGVDNIMEGLASAGTSYTVMAERNRIGSGSIDNFSGAAYGSYTNFLASGNGNRFGYYADYTNSPVTGTGDKYGFTSFIPSTVGGTHYGIWSSATKAGSYAGYFLGSVSIGTTTTNNYLMPSSRGAAGQIMVTDGAGNVTWTNAPIITNDWSVTGNAGTSTATNFIGTTDNVGFIIRTNNLNRMTVNSNGNIGINTTGYANVKTTIATTSDLDNGLFVDTDTNTTANDAEDAIIAVGDNNSGFGGGFFVNTSTTNGIGYGSNQMGYGVLGSAIEGGEYKVGVYGQTGSGNRSAGVMGSQDNNAIGALGYKTSTGLTYGGYFFDVNAGVDTAEGLGRLSNAAISNIGIGAYGKDMSGVFMSNKFGLTTMGKNYGLFVKGKAVVTDELIKRTKTNSETIETFAVFSTTNEVSCKGKSKLNNGEIKVVFDDKFKKLVKNSEQLIINLTAMGFTKGIYVDSYSVDGFVVKEIENNTRNIEFSWSVSYVEASNGSNLDENFENEISKLKTNEVDGKFIKKEYKSKK
ncbi:hypothetical protein GFJ94_10315 [Flavobacterium sp. LMO8]|uniref:beta strand repeat-containing protein n=1 Tax=Flavobacterium sp. LMO8 TaxID=2654244 RepID=UPI0012910002|nr:hypothetical protein [Flavobacterium sp. LMO8]MQP25458.1 hypothetical protein [Flavobacterium sp. LMO8]